MDGDGSAMTGKTSIQVSEGDTFNLLMELVKQGARFEEALQSIDRSLADLRTNTSAQLASLQERMGRNDTFTEVLAERVKTLERESKNGKAEMETLETEHQNLKTKVYVMAAVIGTGTGAVSSALVKLITGG